jgi:hypothetical protein
VLSTFLCGYLLFDPLEWDCQAGVVQSVSLSSGSVGAARNTPVPLDFGFIFNPKCFAKSRGEGNAGGADCPLQASDTFEVSDAFSRGTPPRGSRVGDEAGKVERMKVA